jgi:hypothetical protein
MMIHVGFGELARLMALFGATQCAVDTGLTPKANKAGMAAKKRKRRKKRTRANASFLRFLCLFAAIPACGLYPAAARR